MKKALLHPKPRRLLLAALLLHTGLVWADGANATTTAAPANVANNTLTFPALSASTADTTHWGIGVGAAYHTSPYLGYDAKYSPIPLISFDNQWVHVLGATVDLKVAQWNNVMLTLRGTYALGDGYKGSDSPIFNGMPTRDPAFWFGPALAWHSAYGVLSGDVLTSGNKGQRADISFSKPFQYGNLTFAPHVGTAWLSDKYVGYYYGVPSSLAQPGRNAYAGKSAYEQSVGTRFDYHFAAHQLVTLDLTATYLSSGITDSPLIGKKISRQANLGYLYQFN